MCPQADLVTPLFLGLRPGHAETEGEEPVSRPVVQTKRRAQTGAVQEEGAAAQGPAAIAEDHVPFAAVTRRLSFSAWRIGRVLVVAPLPDVAVHVEQAQIVGHLAAHRPGA